MLEHPEGAVSALQALPAQLRLAVLQCASGELPANVALSHLFLAARDELEAEHAIAAGEQCLSDSSATARLRRARQLWQATPDAFVTVRDVARAVDHHCGYRLDEKAGTELWAAAFDQAARISQSASVALYSLGRSDLLDAATREIVDWMDAARLLRPELIALEIGCGNGRVLHGVAQHVGLVIGLDISMEMLRAARQRRPGAALIRSSGCGLSAFASASCDLIYGVDVFPYLVNSHLAARHIADAARILKPGGALLILNYSYRNDLALDQAELAAAAQSEQLEISRNGMREFALWDGRAFLLQKGPGLSGSPPELGNVATKATGELP